MDINRLTEIYENLVGESITNYSKSFSKNVIINYFACDKFDELKEYLWEYCINTDSKDITELVTQYDEIDIPILFQEHPYYYKCKLLYILIRHYSISESRIRFVLSLGNIIEKFHPMKYLYYELSDVLHKLGIPGCKNAIINIMKDYPTQQAHLLRSKYFRIPRILSTVVLYCELYLNEIPFNTNIIKGLLTLNGTDVMSGHMLCFTYENKEYEIKRIYTKYNLSKYELSNDMANEILFKVMRRRRFGFIELVIPYITQLNRPKRRLYKYMLNCDIELIKKNIFNVFYPLDESELSEMIAAEIINNINSRHSIELYKKIFTLINQSDKIKPFNIQLFIKLYKQKYVVIPGRIPVLYELCLTDVHITFQNPNTRNHNINVLMDIVKASGCPLTSERSIFGLQNKSLDWKITFVCAITYKSNVGNWCKQHVLQN